MTTVVIIDSTLRFKSHHEYFAEKSVLGYCVISYDAYHDLPYDLKDTLVPVRRNPIVMPLMGGLA